MCYTCVYIKRIAWTDELDVLALSEDVNRGIKSGALIKKLLSQGNTLYGTEPQYPDCIIRTTPTGMKAVGHWINGEFILSLKLTAEI